MTHLEKQINKLEKKKYRTSIEEAQLVRYKELEAKEKRDKAKSRQRRQMRNR